VFHGQNEVAVEGPDWNRIGNEVNAKDMESESLGTADFSVLSFPLRKGDVVFRKNARAKRYILRLDAEGRVVITLPSRGTQRDALAFANGHREWIESEFRKAQSVGHQLRELKDGDEVIFKGEAVRLRVVKDLGRPVLELGPHRRFIADEAMDLVRPATELLRTVAAKEIPPQTREIAGRLGIDFKRVSIRNQRTRWGSCSTSGVISLNWRLVMMPVGAMDYVIMHELMHVREMNHSQRFWDLVAEACPDYRKWIDWLDTHGMKLFP